MAAGGYECHFVDPVPESLSCAVCLLPFRDPHLVSCCGSKFCAPCINQLKAVGQPCPVCVQEFTTLLDRGYQRKVINLKVFCSRKSDGCQWEGELHHLDHHEREECGWAEVECSYQCGAHLPRRLMAEHKHEVCPQRPINVKLECFMKSMEKKLTSERKRHESELAAVREEFRISLVEERDAHEEEVEELKRLMESKMAEHRKKTGWKMVELQLLMESKIAELKKTERKMAADLKQLMESKMVEHTEIKKDGPTGRLRLRKRRMESRGNSSKEVWVCFSSESEDEEESVEGSHHGGMAKRHKGEKDRTTFRNTLTEDRDIHKLKKEMEEMKQLLAEQKKMKASKIAEMEKSLLGVKKIVPQMKGILINTHPVPSIEFIVTNYITHKKNDYVWLGSPFYTGPGGYKMCIRVRPSGQGSGAGTHVAVLVHLMRGEYDSRLVWPFRGDITIQLVNYSNDQDHYELTVPFNAAVAAGKVSDRVTAGERAVTGLGFEKFISHTAVESFTKTSQYIVNDCLTFRINKIVVHSV